MGRPGRLSIALLAMALLLSTSAVLASKSNEGFAAYSVIVTQQGGPEHSVVVNETVSGAAKVGFSDQILQLTGEGQNVTYSKLVNSSQNYFPYLTNALSQSFEFSNGSTLAVHSNFSAAGTAETSFQGSKYSLTVFDIDFGGTYANRTASANGTVEVFPSSLVYSVKIGNSTALIDAVLQSTDLPLTQPSAGMGTTAAYVGAGLGIGGVAAGAALVVRHREQKARTQDEKKKPLHWVD
ncbi:MAG: hypothetical protein ACLQEQ_08390 [Nitrososphaerales archaeon]